MENNKYMLSVENVGSFYFSTKNAAIKEARDWKKSIIAGSTRADSVTLIDTEKDIILYEYVGKYSENNQEDEREDQVLFSIRKNGECLGYIEIIDGEIVTSGIIGENVYKNWIELIKGLQGLEIEIDSFFW